MSNVRKHGIILLGIILFISGISYFAFFKENKKEEEILENRIVYLMHNHMLVEYEYKTHKKSIEENIEEMIHSLMQSNAGFTSLLKEETILEKVEIKEDCATLYFTAFSYDVENERRLLESLIYTCTQFENVNRIKLYVQNNELTKMPLGDLSLKDTSRNFGINPVNSNQLYLHKGNSLVLYYKTRIKDKSYFVPKSVRLLHEDDYREIIEVLFSSSNVSSSLTQPLVKHHVISLKDPYFEDGVLNLYLNNKILEDKTHLNEECSQFLKKVFLNDHSIEMIKIHVEDNIYDINVRN